MPDAPKLAGVIGWPINQSLSPLIHTIWAHRAGINGYYIPLAISPAYEDFARAMNGLRAIGFAGVNITIPHKENALRYAAAASDGARAAGAANMLTFGAGDPYADNSDIGGFAKALKERLGRAAQPTSALILGAGGAARAVVIALKRLGFTGLRIANRSPEKAVAIAQATHIKMVDWPARSDALSGVDLVVNTTSLGMAGQPPLEISLDKLKPDAIVADIVYAPLETDLLKAAKARGCKTVDGLSMLMHQAAPGFRAWFGEDPAIDDDLRRALVGELKNRDSR